MVYKRSGHEWYLQLWLTMMLSLHFLCKCLEDISFSMSCYMSHCKCLEDIGFSMSHDMLQSNSSLLSEQSFLSAADAISDLVTLQGWTPESILLMEVVACDLLHPLAPCDTACYIWICWMTLFHYSRLLGWDC